MGALQSISETDPTSVPAPGKGLSPAVSAKIPIAHSYEMTGINIPFSES